MGQEDEQAVLFWTAEQWVQKHPAAPSCSPRVPMEASVPAAPATVLTLAVFVLPPRKVKKKNSSLC